MRQGRRQWDIATVQADMTNRSQTVTHLWRWLHQPAGRFLIQFLVVLTVLPPWAWGDLSASYRWSTTPYLQTFARLVTLIESDTPTATPLPPADFITAQATPPTPTTPTAAATPNPDFADAVWVAKTTIVKLAAATGNRLLELTDIENARVLALDAQRGVLWAYGHRNLHAYQFNGTLVRRIAVPRSGGSSNSSDDDDCDDDGEKSGGDDDDDDDDDECSDGDGHVALAVNWLNGTVWLGTNKTLRHFSHDGKLLGTLALPHHIRALVFDPAHARLWVGTKISVKAHNDAGTVVHTINLGTNPDVQDLALRDHSSGELWVALKDTLRRYSRTGTLLRQLTVKQIAVLASDGQGQVWASTNVSLLRIDLTGKILLTLPQFKGESQLVALATDPVDLSVWAASKKTVWEVSAQGTVLHTVDFRTGPPIHDLVVYVDTTAPVLTFVEPAEGAVLTTHKPTLKLSYHDSGQGVDPDTLEIRHNDAPLAVTCTHSNGEATCVPTTDLPGGPVALTATIEDFAGNISAPATRSFHINRAPIARAGEDQTVPVGTTVPLDGSASSDPDNEPLTFVWQFSLKPASSTAILQDATTATPLFVPDVPGLYSLQLTVTDPHGASDTAGVNITAEVANHPPTITSTAVTTAMVGQSYTYDVDATDPDVGDVLTFSLSPKPDGMTIDPTTGVIQWTPTTGQVGDHPVKVKVQDPDGLFAEQQFIVTVILDNQPPTITSTPTISRWEQLHPTGTPPVPKYAGSLHTYDEVNDRLIAFGGQTEAPVLLNEVWVLSHASGLGGTPAWSKLEPIGTAPTPRSHFASGYDPTANRLIVYGGCSGFCAPLPDAWVLTHANGLGGQPEWLPLPSSNSLGYGVGGYDPVSNRLVVFGGSTAGGGSDTTDVKVLLDANGIGEPRWVTLSPIGNRPPPRGISQPGVYDPLSNTLIIFGGLSSGRIFYNDVWVLSHANGLGGVPTWTQLNPAGLAPILRRLHTMAYDPNSNRLIVSGGHDHVQDRRLNDTWVLTHANGQGGTPEWIKLTSGATPAVASSPTAGYARASNRLIVALGVSTAETVLNDVWLLTNANGQCTAGQPCNYDVDATDPDAGDTLTFSLDTTLAGMTIDPATGLIEWTPTPAQISDHPVTVRVRDASGLSATQTFTLTVAPVAVPNVVGLAPEWAKALIGAADLTVGTETHTGGEIKPNFDTLPSAQGWTYLSTGVAESTVFSIASGVLQQNTLGQGGQAASYGLFSGLVDARLPFSLATRARVLAEENGNLNNYGMEFGFNAGTRGWGFGLGPGRINGFNGEVLSTAIDTTAFHNYLLRARPGTGYTLAVDGSELGGLRELTLPFVRNFIQFGDGTVVVNARGEFAAYSFLQPRVTSQNPPAGTLVPNKSDVDLTIQDGPATATVPNVVGLTQANAAAAIVAANLTVGTITTANSNTVPAGQVISQTPMANTKVPPNFAVNFVVSLGSANRPPAITSTAFTAATVGQPYTYDVEATDPDAGDVLTYSLVDKPDGMTINATTGLIEWTPTIGQVGDRSVKVKAQDQGGLFDEQSFTVKVKATNTAPVAVASLLGAPNLPACVAPPGGLVSWYPGDGNSTDITGPNSPTATIGSPQFVAGKVGQGVSFDGSSGLIVSNNPTIDFGATGSFTVDAWVRVEGKSGTGDNAVIDKRESSQGIGYNLDALLPPLSPSGTAAFNFTILSRRTPSPALFAQVTSRPVPLGEYHLVAGVVDRAKQTISIYLDGVLEQEISIAHVGDLSGASRLFIGHHNADTNTFVRPLIGTIGELEIFNRALTQAEVQSLFLAGSAGKCKIRVGETVTLDGTQSTDPDSDPLSYRWTLLAKPDGSTAVLSDANATQPTFVADKPGTYRVQLVVNDGGVDSAPSELSIAVLDANRPSIALDDSYTTTLGETLTVPAPGVIANDHDADGDTLTATKLTDPADGTLTFNSDGSFAYTPDASVHGPGNTAHTVIATVYPAGAPRAVAINANTNRIFVPNIFGETLAIIDGVTNKIVAFLGGNLSYVEDVAVNPVTNRAYVTGTNTSNYLPQSSPNGDRVSVIDGATTTNTVLTSIPVGSQPQDIAVNPATNRIYVANVASNTVSVINGATNTVIATIPVGQAPRQIGINSHTNRIYVLSAVDDTVSVIEGATNAVVATVPVGDEPRFLEVTPDTNRIYVANFLGDTLSVIDGVSNTVVTTISVGDGPQAIGFNPATNHFYVGNFESDNVSVINRATNTVVGTITVGDGPQAITINPNSNRIYVANFAGGTVSVIDGATDAVIATVPVGAEPFAIGVNPLTDRVYVADFGSHDVAVIHVGDHFTYKVSDGQLDSNVATATIIVERTQVGTVTVPDVVGLPQAAAEAGIVVATLTVGIITQANSNTVPAGNVISQSPAAGTAVAPQTAVNLVISLGSGTANDPPTITSTPVITATVGQPYTYDVEATDPDAGDTLTFSLLPTPPAGMTIDTATGVIQWTPTTAQVGTHNVTARVQDNGGLFDEQSFTVTVSSAPTTVTVPNVVGLDPTAAQTALTTANLTLGTTTTVDSNVALNFTTLPSAQEWTYVAFGNSAPETQVFSLNTSVLQQNTLGLTDRFNFYQLPGVVQAVPFALTVTARVLAQEGDETDAFGFGFAIAVGTEQFAFGLRTDGIHDPVGNILSTTIDTTQFHEYRLEGTPGGSYRLFVDSVLIGSGSPGTRATAAEFLSFGDLSDTANARGEVTKLSFVQNAGKVIAQQPAAGTSVAEGTAVNLTVVKAPVAVTVPDVVGQTQASATATLIAAKLFVGTTTQENSATVPAGNIISQTPTAGTSVAEQTSVALVVSLGPTQVTVPNIVGLTQAAATTALTTAKLTVGTVTTANHPTIPAGSVLSQNPTAGTSVTEGSAVSFVVSLGPGGPPPDNLASILVQPATPLILTTQTQAFTAIGILDDGTSQNLNGLVTSWSSSSATVASIDPTGVATGLADGTTTISATAGSITGSTTLTVKAATPDDVTPPTAALTAPADDATITSPVDIVGTASDTNFFKYILDYAPVGESTFATIVTGTTPVTNGVLGKLDPTLLLNDLFTLRLTVVDRANNQAQTSVQVQVAREQKVGNFTLAFQDLTVPVAGLPITVVRTYDSRDKGKGDFGTGWRLDIQTLRLKVTGVLGADWEQIQSGGVLNRRYDLVPTALHKVAITLPDGRVEEFDFTPTPTSQALAPIEVVTAGYTRRAQTRGTLRALGETSLVTFGVVGPLDLLLESDPSVIYDPRVFEYTTPEGQVIIIDRTAGVQSVTDLNGNKLTFGPNGITHSSGKGVTFTRDAQQRIIQITDPKGNSQSYTYDANGDLKSHSDPAGNTTSFLYNFRHDLIEIKDPRGIRPVRNEYDDAGRLIKHIDAFGKEITYTHNIGVREEIITDRLGQVTKREYDDKGNVVRTTDANGGITDRTYDARGNTLTEKDPLNRTRTYTYDANDNRLSETDPLGNTTSYTYNSRNQVLTVSQPGSGTTTNTYDATGNLTATKDPTGATTTYLYNAQGLQTSQTDALGKTTTYTYDGSGNLLTETNPLNHSTSYTYDSNGNRLTQTTTNNGQTLVTTYQYDALNRLVKTTFPDGSTSQTVYNSIGKQSTTTDQGGGQTSYQYDDLGRLTKTTYPDGTSESSTYDAEGRRLESTDRGGRKTTFAYDALGRLTTTTAPDGAVTQTSYDAAGQVTGTTDALGHGTSYLYDAAGRRTKVTDASGQVTTFTYDAAGNQQTVTDAKGHVTTFNYDANNRRTGVSYHDGTSDSTVYGALGRTTSKTDQGGKTTKFTYDALGRLLTVTDALNQVTSYTYDDLGNQLTQTDANGNTTTFAYDKMGRRTQRRLPAGQTETSGYNAAGNLTSKTDFNGKTTTYTYDAVNRLTSKTPDPSLSEQAVTFSYTSSGQRASMSDASGTTSYTYDTRDRLISKVTPQGTLTYTYDLAGNLLSMDSSNANGVAVDYGYDTLNRLSTVDDTRLPNGVTTYSYDEVGNLESYTYPNGVQSQYTYNTLNRLTNLTISKATTLASFAYTLGAAGSRTAVTEQNGRTASYSYDDLYRLTHETITGDPTGINGSIGYTYDPVGNRRTRTSTVAGIANQTFAYDANDRLSTDTYDPNGNTTGSEGKTYNYDFENHLTNQNGNGVEIVYDGDGNRVAKTVGGVTTRYLIDDRNHTGYAQVLEEIVNGTVQRRYTYGLDLISQNQATGVSFYGYDGHGSVRLLTDVNGNVTDNYTYEAFGNLIASTGATPNNYLYTGEQSDPNLGFYYLRARYLNAGTGRFLSYDRFEGRLREPSTLHKYSYTSNNPINMSDPTGLFYTYVEAQTVVAILSVVALAVAVPALRALREQPLKLRLRPPILRLDERIVESLIAAFVFTTALSEKDKSDLC